MIYAYVKVIGLSFKTKDKVKINNRGKLEESEHKKTENNIRFKFFIFFMKNREEKS